MSSLSIVVPCYNEEDNIQRFVKDWHTELSQKLDDFEMIIVNDCSTDSTPQMLAEIERKYPHVIVLHNEKNQKYGETMIKGVKHASKEYVIWVDSDYSHCPADLWKLWEYRKKYNAVWGVRGVAQRDSRGRFLFTMGNILLTLVLFGKYFCDPNCAFKLYRRKELLSIVDSLVIHPIMTTTKIAIRTKQMKYSIKEVPVAYLKRAGGAGSIKHVPAVIAGIKEMLRFRLGGK